MRNISQSQINLFRSCPYAYALRYLYKKEGIWWDPSIIEVGSRVHDAIDIYYKQYYKTDCNEEDIKNIVYGILRNKWDTSLSAEYLKKAYDCICHFSSFAYNNICRGNLEKPLTEVKIYSDGLMGIIDYVDLVNKKVIDFKTNTRAGISYENKMQAVMYKILVKDKFGIDVPYFTFQYLYPDEVRVVKYNEEVMKVRQDIDMYVNKIKEAWKTKTFPKEPRTPKTCNGCQFNYYCGGI